MAQEEIGYMNPFTQLEILVHSVNLKTKNMNVILCFLVYVAVSEITLLLQKHIFEISIQYIYTYKD